jgi:hypothetical protein
MKLDTRTVQVLRNFSTINPSLVFKKGNILSTISPGKAVIATAKLDISFPQDFAIYDLSEFLGALSLFNEPELDFGTRSVTIQSGRSKVVYIYGNEDNIVKPPSLDKLKLPETVYEFDLPSDVLSRVMKAMGTFKLPELAVTSKDGEVQVQAINHKNPTGNAFSEFVGDCETAFRGIIHAENLKMIPDSYHVTLTQGLAKFISKDIEYYIAVEAESEF